MKVIVIFILFMGAVKGAAGQEQVGKYVYKDETGVELATLLIKNNAFLINSAMSLIKPDNSDKVYQFVDYEGEGLAIASTITNYLGAEFMHIDYDEWIKIMVIKTDTIYYPVDTIINSQTCKKVDILFSARKWKSRCIF